MKKGISPVIATVILVAVTLAIAVAIIGWLFGLWGSLAGGTPQISVPSAYIALSYSGGSLSKVNVTLYIKNSGAGSDKLLRAEVLYKGTVYTCGPTLYYAIPGTTPSSSSLGSFVIPANTAYWVNITCNTLKTANIKPGDSAVLKLYFDKSGIMPINLVAQNITG